MSTNDFCITHLGTDEQRRIAQAVLSVLPDPPDGGGCGAFHTPQQWAARGEQYGRESVLVLAHDGGDLAPFCNFDYGDYERMERLSDALRKIGYWVEQCTGWYSAVYAL